MPRSALRRLTGRRRRQRLLLAAPLLLAAVLPSTGGHDRPPPAAADAPTSIDVTAIAPDHLGVLLPADALPAPLHTGDVVLLARRRPEGPTVLGEGEVLRADLDGALLTVPAAIGPDAASGAADGTLLLLVAPPPAP